ncbi:methionine--tRNA ligase [Chitinivibrio alkaliphilus]|uniref:Methionine--tRNA ligase n=1 Tax=Chitinivibrio alkaliphilus ACht1 TaxID=1313304 RepID=U7D2R3_9BACT|nr:methionine--tRNA ligase [Chitinivibrio alkaliphilus]ERP30804.1 methionyl-tRNA synthetase [Chitinivibrio alkaliphilus ACht1]
MKPLMNKSDVPVVVTMALPYANGDIHLGHMVEAVQTDMYVRTQRMAGRKTIYVCADDTHGTPIELNARAQGITPEELIGKAHENHVRDYAAFGISFDTYHSTNSEENRHWAEWIFQQIDAQGGIRQREVEQFYCEHDKRFLPDRLIKGTCPKCGAEDQYGDVCEKCGSTYDPEDMKNPYCTLCGNSPVLKKSTHFFVDLAEGADFLTEYLNRPGVLQQEMKNFVMQWVKEGLKEWCISRDAPYFGFKIPGTKDKYFYVWLDAPVGYIAATHKWCKDNGEDIASYWYENSTSEVVHFIGKDITYFHTLFWPYMLKKSGLKLPSKLFIHGFLSVEGEKMSKSRGTFILADKFVRSVTHPEAAQFLRLYYATKLSNNTNDLDFNIQEFISRTNTMLVNNIGNFQNRTFTFLQKFFSSTVPSSGWDETMAAEAKDTVAVVKTAMEEVRYKDATERIYAFGNQCNKYFQDQEPWKLVKENMAQAEEVMVTCVNLVKTLAVLLKPIIPEVVSRMETTFDAHFTWEDGLFSSALAGRSFKGVEKLVTPLEEEHFAALYTPEVSDDAPVEPEEELIDFSDFLKVKLRIGEVRDAEKIRKSKKLLKLVVLDGYKERQIIAGIGQSYSAEELVGKRIVFVSNLKPAKLMGHLSEGMLLAAENSKGELSYLESSRDFPAGTFIS